MALLLLSLLALVIGPLLLRVADRARESLQALDGFVLVAVSGLVLVHIIPHGLAAAGWPALVLALVGFFGPGLLERTMVRAAHQTHTVAVWLAMVGLVVHEFLDGVALAAPTADHAHADASLLALAVAIHRLPVAIMVWWLLRKRTGFGLAAATLAAMGVATVAGFGLGEQVSGADARWLGMFQALVGGSLLHVLIHRPTPLAGTPDRVLGGMWSGLGALAGLVLVALLSDKHLPFVTAPGASDFGATFLALAAETAPALLLAFALAGMVPALLPNASLRWMRTGRPLTESMRGVVFGLPLPICSCGVIPLYRTLVVQGVPTTASMSFLVATPELGLDAILISLPLLGAELATVRVVAAAAVALLVGLVIGRMALQSTPRVAAVPAPQLTDGPGVGAKVRAGLRHGFGEVVDHIGPWLLLGLAIAALAEPLLRSEWIERLPAGLDVVLFAVVGLPSYVCASAATPLAAVLIHKGVSPGAAIAFLLAAPAANVTTFGVLARLHGRGIALAFGAAIVALAIGVGVGVNAMLPGPHGISIHDVAEEAPGLLAMMCLAALGVLFALSVLRQGPRGFVGQILSPHDDGHDHGHGDGDGHDHDHDHDHGHR